LYSNPHFAYALKALAGYNRDQKPKQNHLGVIQTDGLAVKAAYAPVIFHSTLTCHSV